MNGKRIVPQSKRILKAAFVLVLIYLSVNLNVITSGKKYETATKHLDMKPNFIFIVADDLGYNDVGYHGSEIKTPYIDKLAMTGVKLENYYVQPICTPTRGQLLTGRYQCTLKVIDPFILLRDICRLSWNSTPSYRWPMAAVMAEHLNYLPATGLNWVLWPATPAGLSPDIPTIAQKLQQAGYATHMVGKWHLGFYNSKYLPTNRGFDTFFGFLSGHSHYYTHQTGNYKGKVMIGYDLMENDRPANISLYNGSYSTNLFSSKVKDLIRKQDKNKPMFIYLSFQAVHAPLQVPEQYSNMYSHIDDLNRRIYAGMVTCMDDEIGSIVEEIKHQGIYNNTVIIFSTDNGANPKVGGSNWPLKGTKSTLWEGGIRAVGFVHSPLFGFREVGYTSNELIHVTDWFPTILHLAGSNVNDSETIDGVDQWASLKYGTPSRRKEILHNIDPVYNNTYHRRRFAMRFGSWKIIVGQSGSEIGDKGNKSSVSLYNINKDPEEKENVCERFPYIMDFMLRKIEIYEKEMIPSSFPNIDINADPELHGGFWQPWT